MPGFVIPGLLNMSSGGVNLLSGNFFSGQGTPHPVGGIQLRADVRNSGAVYIAYSGGMTITSGGLNASGMPNLSGAMDGMPMYAGDGYFVPMLVFQRNSGNPNLFVLADAACSGTARLYVDPF